MLAERNAAEKARSLEVKWESEERNRTDANRETELPRSIVGKRILIVDDEATMLALMKRQLDRTGYTVDTVTSAIEAETALQNSHYDLVITDMVLKRETGELVSRLVEKYSPGTPVLFMSGYIDLLTMSGARVLEKPYSSQMLADAIHAAIDDVKKPEIGIKKKTRE